TPPSSAAPPSASMPTRRSSCSARPSSGSGTSSRSTEANLVSPQPPPLRLPPGARVALGFIVVTIVALLAVVVVLAARGFVAERTLYYASVAALLLSSLGPSTSLISSWRRGHPIRAYRSALRQLATQLGGQLVRDT